MKTLFFNNAAEAAQTPIGSSWESPTFRASLWKLILSMLLSNDYNRVHVNPLTAWRYKSKLGGLSFCGDAILSMTKAMIHNFIRFKDDVEILAHGYESVRFKRPLRFWTRFSYRFTFVGAGRFIDEVKCLQYKWQIDVLDSRGKVICTGIWITSYQDAKLSPAGLLVQRWKPVAADLFAYVSLAAIAIGITAACLSYQPPFESEYTFPIGP